MEEFALLQYSLENVNYCSQNDHYGGESNIDEYNKIYEKALNNRYFTDEKFQENIKKIYYDNNVLKN